MHVRYPNFQNTACSAFHPSQETSLQGANSSPALDAKDNFSLVFLFLKISPTAPWSEPRNSLSGEFPYRFLNVHPSGYSSSTPHPPPHHPTPKRCRFHKNYRSNIQIRAKTQPGVQLTFPLQFQLPCKSSY